MCTGLRFLWGCGVDGGWGDVVIVCSFLALGSNRTYDRPEHPTQNSHTCFAHNMGGNRAWFWVHTTSMGGWGLNEVARPQGSRKCPLLRNGATRSAILVVHHRCLCHVIGAMYQDPTEKNVETKREISQRTFTLLGREPYPFFGGEI